MIRPLSLCVAALAVDAWIFWQLAEGIFPERNAWLFPLARGAACLLFSLSLPGLLPPRFCPPPQAFRLFACACAFFIPVFGMTGLLVCVIPALHSRRLPAGAAGWRRVQPPGLPLRPARVRPSGAIAGADNLAGVLRDAGDPARRAEALIATLALEGRHAAPLLRLALKDPADDVRLLAYILLNRKEQLIVERIGTRMKQLHGATRDLAFALHKALAHDYWELACIAASAGSATAAFRLSAREHAQSGLLLHPCDIDLQLLCGRIDLRDMRFDAAGDAFASAHRAGLAVDKTAPFLAEIAFFRRCYSDVKKHLARTATGGRPSLNRISAYWRAKERVGNDPVRH